MSAAPKAYQDLFKFLGLTLFFTLIFLMVMDQHPATESEVEFLPYDRRENRDLTAELHAVYSSQNLGGELNSRHQSDQQAVILAGVEAIDAQVDQFRVEEASIEGESAEGGTLLSYFSGDALQKTEKIVFGETGRLEEFGYYQEGKLIYVDSIQIDYSRPITMTDQDLRDFFEGVPEEEIPTSMKTFTEMLGAHNQYFFEDETLISWVRNGIQIQPDTKEFLEKKEKLTAKG